MKRHIASHLSIPDQASGNPAIRMLIAKDLVPGETVLSDRPAGGIDFRAVGKLEHYTAVKACCRPDIGVLIRKTVVFFLIFCIMVI